MEGRFKIGARVVIVSRRLPNFTGRTGTVERVLANPEGIEILDQYIVRINGQEITFRANELKLAQQANPSP